MTRKFKTNIRIDVEIEAESADAAAACLDNMSTSNIAERIDTGELNGTISRTAFEDAKHVSYDPILREIVFRSDSIPHAPVLGFAPATPCRNWSGKSIPIHWAVAYGGYSSVENTIYATGFKREVDLRNAGYQLALASIDEEGTITVNFGNQQHRLTAEDVYGHFDMDVPDREVPEDVSDDMEP